MSIVINAAQVRFLLAVFTFAVAACPQAANLRAGLELTGTLSGKTPAAYPVSLAAGDFLHVVVGQTGSDVLVTLKDPEGKTVFVSDSNNGAYGPETVAYVGPMSGEYRLEVHMPIPAPNSAFSLRVLQLRPAAPNDREMAAAMGHFTAGDRARGARTAEGWKTALDEYGQALPSFVAQGDRYYQALIQLCWGATLAATGQFRPALDRFQQSSALFGAVGDERRVTATLNFIGGMQDVLGDPAAARISYEIVLARHRASGNRPGEGLVLHNLAVLEQTLGNWLAMASDLQLAMPIVKETGDRRREALLQHGLAVAYLGQGATAEALPLLNAALATSRQIGDKRGEGDTLSTLGYVELTLQRPEAALASFAKSVAIAATTGDKRGEGITRRNWGWAYQKLGFYADAERELSSAISIAESTQDRRQSASARELLAATLLLAGEPARALPLAEGALGEFQAIQDRSGEARTLATLARIRAALGQMAAARTAVESSLALAENIRAQSVAQDFQSAYLAERQDDYEFAIDLLMRMAEPRAAFAMSERARARGLLDMLAEAGSGLRVDADPALLAKQRAISEKINALGARLLPVYGRPAAEPILESIRQLEGQRRAGEEAIRKASPRYASLTQPKPVNLARLQTELLDANSLLLEYSLGKERSYVWLVGKGEFRAFSLPARATLDEQTRKLLTLMPGADGRATAAAARVLSDSVLAPLAPFLKGERVLLVADGALQRVPFAMLPLPGSEEPLVTRFESVTLPSASTLALLRAESRRRKPPTKAIAMFADPVFSGAPTTTRLLEHLQAGAKTIPQLPYTRREAERIVKLSPKPGNLLALGLKANRAAALDPGLAEYRYLHFATHGYLDPERPSLSALLLSFENEKHESEDGFLRVNDIYNLQFRADLVVLSACQTGLGKEVRGEGLVGLPRAFLYAGAPRVVVSLWNVSDEATAELMSTLYRKMLKEHQRPAAALRQAQLALRKHNKWAAPYYWAAFFQTGEWQ